MQSKISQLDEMIFTSTELISKRLFFLDYLNTKRYTIFTS